MHALALLLAVATPTADGADSALLAAGWVEASRSGTLVIYNRDKPGSDIKELLAVGTIDAPPWVVKNVVDDCGNYKEFMPYTKESRIVAREAFVTTTYQRIAAPLVDERDYTLRIEDVSRVLPDGKTVFKNAWRTSKLGPKPVDGVVRVEIDDGSWTLEEKDGGQKTKVTYWLYTSPGGSLPSWLINRANNTAIPGLFEAVTKAAHDDKYRRSHPQIPEAKPSPVPALSTAPAPAPSAVSSGK